MLDVGMAAPDFELEGSDGKTHTLSQYAGQPVVLYFYPKDNTPGCTTQACDFRDNMARATAKGAVVLGVSKDSLKSHANFIKKQELNFVLLSDPEVKLQEAYGVWAEKKNYGRTYMGTVRSTFLIDKDGKLAQIWRNIRVKGHVDKVLTALEALDEA